MKTVGKKSSYCCFFENLEVSSTKEAIAFHKIVEGVENGTLYGFLLVDIHTSNHLKEKYKDFSVIIKKHVCV